MRFEVTWHPEVESDLRGLGDDEVVKRALELMLSLREEPRAGNQLRERYNMRVLGGCRSIRFDRTGWQGRPRYRLVFENEPSYGESRREGEAHIVWHRVGTHDVL